MIRWVAVIFIALFVFYPLLPWLGKLRVGRVPGDVRFRLRGIIFCLPFGSTVLWSVLALVIAELVSLSCLFC
ncbi:DUF2905 domain-containing protein [Noviherbaspirillum cavernae]|uniref:DUF2905 domain-containing protein n=1 Tax=Noviherbaspirillum cavernae TaxID=2320862 RepID=A0A418X4E8_9BURK|nr:DUF2905 domain-containing protein [Noviherbaspirillum cavernae]RJG07353.1 DUF2905 domain-containing protein [Noviherbaspirillum cavernae]